MFIEPKRHYDAASSVGAQFQLSHITLLTELSSENLSPSL
jgi:hypothetical protein